MRVADPAQAWFEAAIAAFGFGVDPTVVAVSLGAAVLALALWVAWRWPALMLALGLAALALRPQLLWGDRNVGYEWGLHQTLLVVGLAVNALHFGVRKSINWPILALSVVFGLNLLFGHLHDDLTTGLMLTGLVAPRAAFRLHARDPGAQFQSCVHAGHRAHAVLERGHRRSHPGRRHPHHVRGCP